jgi:hypothetical protein
MNVVLLRVGIDTECGGIHSPLLPNDEFEFIPIPDSRSLDERTYGNAKGRTGRKLIEYFPEKMQEKMCIQSMHVDPEFKTFTYGDPTPPKRNLSRLKHGDLLVFYSGMKGWRCAAPPALYLTGFFWVKLVGFASGFSRHQISAEFSQNFHVRHKTLFKEQRDRLVLIKGDQKSRLFRKAHKVGEAVRRKNGSVWQLISPTMEKVFGRFGGIGSLQRSTPRWVDDKLTVRAADFIVSLE